MNQVVALTFDAQDRLKTIRKSLAPDSPSLAPDNPSLVPDTPSLVPDNPSLAPHNPSLASDSPFLGHRATSGYAPSSLLDPIQNLFQRRPSQFLNGLLSLLTWD